MKKISAEQFVASKKSAGIRIKIAFKIFTFLFSPGHLKGVLDAKGKVVEDALKGEYEESVKVMTGKDDIAPGHLPALQKLIEKNKISAEVGGVLIRKENKKGDEVSRLTAITVNYK